MGGIWHSQGCVWGVHGFVTDKEGNLYTAEVRTGRVQKHTPRKGCYPAFLAGSRGPRCGTRPHCDVSNRLFGGNAVRKAICILGVVAITLMLVPSPAVAHHSSAMFDSTTEITLKGTVAEWKWINPHCTLRIDVKDNNGTVKTWAVATSNIADLSKRGWSRKTFSPGDQVTVTARPAKSGEPVGMIESVVLADGRKLP